MISCGKKIANDHKEPMTGCACVYVCVALKSHSKKNLFNVHYSRRLLREATANRPPTHYHNEEPVCKFVFIKEPVS